MVMPLQRRFSMDINYINGDIMPITSNIHAIRPQQTYGLTNAVYAASQNPIVVGRAPQPTDQAFLGTIWVDPVNQNAYVLVAIVANQSTWLQIT